MCGSNQKVSDPRYNRREKLIRNPRGGVAIHTAAVTSKQRQVASSSSARLSPRLLTDVRQCRTR